MKAFRNILVPTDFSEYSLAVCEYLAALGDVRLHLLHVVVDSVNQVYYSGFPADRESIQKHSMNGAMKELHDVAEHVIHFSGDVRRAVRCGEAYKEIVRYAQDENIDLILMATHGRTGLSHVVMGSVAEKVVRHATVPVLTVKPEELKNTGLVQEDIEEQLHMQL